MIFGCILNFPLSLIKKLFRVSSKIKFFHATVLLLFNWRVDLYSPLNPTYKLLQEKSLLIHVQTLNFKLLFPAAIVKKLG